MYQDYDAEQVNRYFSNDSSAPPSKITFSEEVHGTVYGLNEWATFIKCKKIDNYFGGIIRGTYIKNITPNRFT